MSLVIVFVFKRKTAYEMRSSYWSSDVCSSGLFDQVMSAVRTSPELVALGKDGRGEDRFTSRDMIDTEQRLSQAGDRLADRAGHGLSAAAQMGGRDTAESGSLALGSQNKDALAHNHGKKALANVVAYAGGRKN